METMMQILARELGRSQRHVENVVSLLDEGNTIPFIARYRKELHGSMDDTTLRALEERLQYLRNLEKRREEIKSAIEGQGKLTDELSAAIDAAATLSEVLMNIICIALLARITKIWMRAGEIAQRLRKPEFES